MMMMTTTPKSLIQNYILLLLLTINYTVIATDDNCCNVYTVNDVRYYCICGSSVALIHNVCYCGSDSSAPPCTRNSCNPAQTTGVTPITTGNQPSVTTGSSSALVTTGNIGTTSNNTPYPNQSSSSNGYILEIVFFGMVGLFILFFVPLRLIWS